MRKRCKLFYMNLVVILLISGCATKMVITPQAMEINVSDFKLKGKIEYDGNKEYLPRTIINENESVNQSFTFQYSYLETYGMDKTPQALPLFNPLSLVGFPIGENTLVINGKLIILKGKEVIKEYSATCGLEKMRSLFSEGETFSELRRKGLLAVRNNIEFQMYQDRGFLSGITSGK